MSQSGPKATFYGPRPGHTPRLVIDPAVIVRQVNRFRSALPDAEIYFPVKCCPLPVALLTLHASGCHFEYASIAEIRALQAIDLLRRPGVFGAPARSASDSAAASAAGVKTFVIDSVDEARKLSDLGDDIDVMIRLEVESSDTTMPLSTKFGVTASGNQELTRACADLGLILRGYVFHVGSQTRSTEPWASALQAVSFARDAADHAGLAIDTLDIGGGFPVGYRGAPVAGIDEIGETVARSLERTGLDDLRLIAEPGRFLVANAGTIHAHVLATTRDGNHARAVLDVGVFNGLYEVLEGIEYDFHLAGGREVETPARLWQLAGPSCDGNDIIGTERAIPDSMSADDVLVVPDAGAYADSYASDFCGLDVPQVVIASPSGRDRVSDGVVRVNSSHQLFDLARELELQLFTKAGMLDEDGSLTSYATYDPHSVMNIAFVRGEAVGVLREIWPSDLGLKTVNDLDTWPTTPQILGLIGEEKVADIGTLAVAPDFTGGDIALSLYSKAYRAARAYGFTHWIAAIDNVVLAYMRSSLGFDFVDLGPSVDYIGSPSTPVVGDLAHFVQTANAADRSHWGALSEGSALDPLDDFVGPTSWEGDLPVLVSATIDLRSDRAERKSSKSATPTDA